MRVYEQLLSMAAIFASRREVHKYLFLPPLSLCPLSSKTASTKKIDPASHLQMSVHPEGGWDWGGRGLGRGGRVVLRAVVKSPCVNGAQTLSTTATTANCNTIVP